MQNVNNFSKWSTLMANKKTKNDNSNKDLLPKIILIKSENTNVDRQKNSDEIRYYLTQIMLLADKIGRPSKDQLPEVNDVA
jgi:hypothetical protein